jgi:DNA-binding NtrC family response regulator
MAIAPLQLGNVSLSTQRRRILVVSESLALANNLLVWLREAGYDPAIVTSFSAGKEHLRTAPDILITELKLREYNGLHLALRAHLDGIPTAVIGASDPGFAEDAQEFGARYVVDDCVDRDDILLLIDGLLSARRSLAPEPFDWDSRQDASVDYDFETTAGHRGGVLHGRPVIH